MSIKNKLALSFVVLLLLMQGCQTGAENKEITGETMTIEHKLGSTEVAEKPSRIVVLDIGALETMHILGVKPVGIPKKYMPEYLSELKDDDNIADVGSVIKPDFEAISALNPEVILISTRQERFYEELTEIAPTIFVGTDSKDYIPSFKRNTMIVAQIVDREDEAVEKLKVLEKKMTDAQARFSKDENKALFLIYNNGRFSAFGKGSRFGFIHDVLGMKPVMEFNDESVHGQRISNELLAEANPDYLFIIDRNAVVLDKVSNKAEIENPLLQQTKAFKNGKIFYLDPNVWFISGGGLLSVDLMLDDVVALF
ncbi:ABC transporter substrate-binding protein [Sphingobacterium sp. UT-1RO-CII-1]|uniref:siderophore ABC transporter substrate-binding protein n=1 Tax=Sphingobacterium sp. UT-1RO-CII-1 TaxID=2995225 RepID=UPI00227A304D|nr:ABC transporter substrate-binding protein [Sphingobacterium sp. UT-1RO-CII-1]MCY4779593.1 ABC transporter substrate-binding protein [Sphingobacterium sp. UT-1RO-CII-1]